MITIETFEDMFARMRANTPWDVDGELLWGYFFTDPNPEKLTPVAAELIQRGYRYVDLTPTDDNKTYFLHVERIEKHTPVTLNQRNAEFYRLAEQYQIESYDGMDVGPANK